MNHYYTNNENLTSNIKDVEYTFKGNLLKLNSDNGVFSKTRVDYGTNVLLNNLPELSDNMSILDVGCGYGIIGLALAKSNKTFNIDMIDVNDRAINLAKENARKNGINNVFVYNSYIYENVNKTFDVIITNPPIRAGKEVVNGIVLSARHYLRIGGFVICVIQKKQGAESLIARMNKEYGNCDIIKKEKGYYILMSKNI